MPQHVRVLWEVGQQHESPILVNMRTQVIILHNRVGHKERQRCTRGRRSNVVRGEVHRDVQVIHIRRWFAFAANCIGSVGA